MNTLIAGASLILFLLAIGLVMFYFTRIQLNAQRVADKKREKADKLALTLNPYYRSKVEEDRRYQLETEELQLKKAKQNADIYLAQVNADREYELRRERQQAELEIMRAKFALERYIALHRVTPETYLIDEEPTSLTALPSLKSPSNKEVNIITNSGVQLPSRYDLMDIFRNGSVSPDQIFLGKNQNGEEIYCKGSQLHHGAFNASTGRGKTVLERGILTQLLFIGHHVVLCDLKFALITEDNLDYRPIAKRLYDLDPTRLENGLILPNLLRKEAQIAAFLHHVAYNEIEKRLDMRARGDYSYRTLDIFVEELIALTKAYPQVSGDIVRIIALGRELRVNLFTAAQNFLVRDTNMSGGARENFITAYFLGGDMRSGCQILDMGVKELDEYLKSNNIQLGRGIGMLRNEFVQPEASLVSLGTASNDALYYLLGRANDFSLEESENLFTTEIETDPIIEPPELTKARELWEEGARSDRKLLSAMKEAGFKDMTLYQANQIAKQLRSEEKQSA